LRSQLTSHSHPNILPAAEEETADIFSGGNLENKTESFPKTFFERTSEPRAKSVSIGEQRKQYSIDQYAQVYGVQAELKRDFDDGVKVLGAAFDAYIIVENSGELYIFDQHAAAERVRYEIYLSQISGQNIKIQQMLMPENFETSSSFAETLKSNLELFNSLGVEVKEFGENSFRVAAYPAVLGSVSMEGVIKKVVEDLEEEKIPEIEKRRDKIIRSACRASIKAGDKIAPPEIKKLISDLFKCEHPFTCPHGRPTAYKISKSDLEKFFKRK